MDLDCAILQLLIQSLLVLLFALLLQVVFLCERVKLLVEALQFDLVLLQSVTVRLYLVQHGLHLLALLAEVLFVDGNHLLLLNRGLPFQNALEFLQLFFFVLQLLLLPVDFLCLTD